MHVLPRERKPLMCPPPARFRLGSLIKFLVKVAAAAAAAVVVVVAAAGAVSVGRFAADIHMWPQSSLSPVCSSRTGSGGGGGGGRRRMRPGERALKEIRQCVIPSHGHTAMLPPTRLANGAGARRAEPRTPEPRWLEQAPAPLSSAGADPPCARALPVAGPGL